MEPGFHVSRGDMKVLLDVKFTVAVQQEISD